MIPIVLCSVIGLSCIIYASFLANTVTNTLGEYEFLDVDPGDYTINASAPGYYDEHISSFTVVTGVNTAPDITLFPIPTATPAETPTCTLTPTPTNTPTSTPTMTPTNTPTPTETPVSCVAGNDLNTVLMIHSDDPDNSTNFVDTGFGRSESHTITPIGNVHHETDNARFGSSAIHFDGSGDYLSISDSADWDFGAADFTIDFWINFSNVSQAYQGFFGKTDWNWIHLIYNEDLTMPNRLQLLLGNGGWINGAHGTHGSKTNWANGTWHHIAVVRHSNNYKVFVNGLLDISCSTATALSEPDVPVFFGNACTGSFYFNGYMDEVRISHGIARWTTDFTPPDLPFCDP